MASNLVVWVQLLTGPCGKILSDVPKHCPYSVSESTNRKSYFCFNLAESGAELDWWFYKNTKWNYQLRWFRKWRKISMISEAFLPLSSIFLYFKMVLTKNRWCIKMIAWRNPNGTFLSSWKHAKVSTNALG